MRAPKHFPTILGLVFLVGCIGVGIYLTSSKTSFSSKASGDCQPSNFKIANITDTSADISFITSGSCLSSVTVDNKTFEDVKSLNTGETPASSKIHYFQAKYLSATTSYSFNIISGGQTFSDAKYSFRTSSKPSKVLPTSNLAWGKVLSSDGKTAGVAIVYLNIPGAAPLSSFVTSNGNWSISLASSFNEAKTDWFTPPSAPTDENIVVVAEDGSITQIANNTGLNNPVPDIIIGQNSLTAPKITPQVGTLGNISPVQTVQSVDILNPKDGDSLPVGRPDFFGVAPQNSKVLIEVHSDVAITGESTSDNSGSWHWSPPANLDPGSHTITVKVQDPTTGVWNTVTRSFIVLASDGSSPAYTASGSASIITPTPITTDTPTPSPTLAPSPTTTADTPTPTVAVATPTVIKPPVTGNSLPTTLIISTAVVFFIISLKLIL